MLRIGILGGSFDPVHNGHLGLAQEVQEDYRLDKVVFVPAGANPLKSGSEAPATDRVNMLQLALVDHPTWEVDLHDVLQHGKSYTIDMVNYMRRKYPIEKLYLIMGSDLVSTLCDWKDSETLEKTISFVIRRRPEDERCSSKIRMNLHNGRSIHAWVPPAVDSYIRHRNLYQG